MNADKNLELTRLIGRRLREVCSRDIEIANKLPAAIAGGLAALRDIEMRAAELDDRSMTDAVAQHAATRRE